MIAGNQIIGPSSAILTDRESWKGISNNTLKPTFGSRHSLEKGHGIRCGPLKLKSDVGEVAPVQARRRAPTVDPTVDK